MTAQYSVNNTKQEKPENINKHSSQEISGNVWLKKKVELRKKEVTELEVPIHHLEEENLLFISQLFNCRLADLKISRPLFLTQAAGLGEQKDFPEEMQSESESLTNKQKNEKELSLLNRLSFLYDDANENVSIRFSASDLSYLLYEDEKDFKEYTELGPLEVKLTTIEGQKKPIHEEVQEMTKKDWEDAWKTEFCHM
ncbi:coiled-coil domain-containing protein 83-like [Trichosurus vulpecula]|uniref:coiled-coil domain-containing protein 83-like n=1 Tax=Trichosurus vulpecula TaxID=9337 RepID=UPI00186AFDE8|nr:coiled-coil domain-containing protein 83-like [Trichosurus vulpecula]